MWLDCVHLRNLTIVLGYGSLVNASLPRLKPVFNNLYFCVKPGKVFCNYEQHLKTLDGHEVAGPYALVTRS